MISGQVVRLHALLPIVFRIPGNTDIAGELKECSSFDTPNQALYQTATALLGQNEVVQRKTGTLERTAWSSLLCGKE